jgi:hypothetical protein
MLLPQVFAGMISNITDADIFEYYLTHRTTLTWSDAQIEAATGYPRKIGCRFVIRGMLDKKAGSD